MRASWAFDRGLVPVDGTEVPIKCRFSVMDEAGSAGSVVEFVISESAAVEMIDALRKVASPLTVTGNGSSP